MRAFDAIGLALQGQTGHLFPWVPVFLGNGIGLYFMLRVEPSFAMLVVLCATAAACGVLAARAGVIWGVFWGALALFTAGVALAGLRSHAVAAPVLGWRYYGPVEGTVVAIDRSASDALRLTLAKVVLARLAPQDTPARVRVALHGNQEFLTPAPGQRVILTAHLSPPQGPVEPGGFDFQRHAWFRQLGAVGYTRTPALLLYPAEQPWSVMAMRMALADHIRARLPGHIGGFAAAVTAGDRSGIPQSVLQDLRASNLAHLLAISGLHMGLLVGFVFAALRFLLSLWPALALRIPVKRLAALLSLAAAAGYLALSGGNVATQRAFVMAGVALLAVMADRRVLSLRAVALAAVIVCLLRPEALMGPGFQMSFAATTALVAVFGALRKFEIGLGPVWLRPVIAVVLSSFVAGAATAPFGAAHFNQLAHYGLLANLLSVPVMGLVVIPAAVVAAALAPFGLDWIGLNIMGFGLNWILGVAHWVAGLQAATRPVVTPPSAVLPLIGLGFLLIILWQGRLRWGGIIPVILAIVLWSQADRPQVLIAESGGLVGVMTKQGRALSKDKGQGFVARVWLENDGDDANQWAAAQRWQTPSQSRIKQLSIGTADLYHIQGKRALAAFSGCQAGDLVVVTVAAGTDWACAVYDPRKLRATGALALDITADGKLQISTAREVSGRRLWNLRP